MSKVQRQVRRNVSNIQYLGVAKNFTLSSLPIIGIYVELNSFKLFQLKSVGAKTLFIFCTSRYISVLIARQFRAQIGVNLTEMNLVLL